MSNYQDKPVRPSLEDLDQLIQSRKRLQSRLAAIWSIFRALVVVAALAVLLSTQLFPVFRVYSHSMTPTLNDGEIVISLKTNHLNKGDLIAFYYNNKILLKRVIAEAGDLVHIDESGLVSINGERLSEPYVSEPSLGRCDIELPYPVPEGCLFVMGDNRFLSLDSRSGLIGVVSSEQIIGKIIFKIWPLNILGLVS